MEEVEAAGGDGLDGREAELVGGRGEAGSGVVARPLAGADGDAVGGGVGHVSLLGRSGVSY